MAVRVGVSRALVLPLPYALGHVLIMRHYSLNYKALMIQSLLRMD